VEVEIIELFRRWDDFPLRILVGSQISLIETSDVVRAGTVRRARPAWTPQEPWSAQERQHLSAEVFRVLEQEAVSGVAVDDQFGVGQFL
jgi:hypothetical protein